jgi:hypothetical protein
MFNFPCLTTTSSTANCELEKLGELTIRVGFSSVLSTLYATFALSHLPPSLHPPTMVFSCQLPSLTPPYMLLMIPKTPLIMPPHTASASPSNTSSTLVSSKPIHVHVVQVDTLDIMGCVLDAWLASKGLPVSPSASVSETLHLILTFSGSTDSVLHCVGRNSQMHCK